MTFRSAVVSAAGFTTSAAASTTEAAQTITILDAPLYTVTINGSPAVVTGQTIVVIISATVGVIGLIATLYNIARRK